MSGALHHEQTGRVHRPVNMVASADVRSAASYTSVDLYKFYQEADSGLIYQLMALSPVGWRQITDAPPVAHTHSASDVTSGTIAYARLPVGTTASTVAAGDDPRMSDARTPLVHVHSANDVTSGTLAYARLPVGTTASTVAAGDDPRMSDARTPLIHTHDAADITSGTFTRDRILDMVGASSSANGRPGAVIQPNAGDQAKFLRGDGTWQPVALLPGASNYNMLYYNSGSWQATSDVMIYPVLGTSTYGIKIGGISSNGTMLDIVPVADKTGLYIAGNTNTLSTAIFSNTTSGQALYLTGQSGAFALRVGTGYSGFGVGLSRTISATVHGTGSTILGAATTAVADGALEDNEINIYSTSGSLRIKHKHSGVFTTHILPGATATGWTAATGVATRSGFSTSDVTLPELAEHVKALMDDLLTHGLLGS